MFLYCECGFIYEGLLNYLVLFGWLIGLDCDVFLFDEFIVVFDIENVNFNLVCFD